MSTLGLGLSLDLVISHEYGWLARQRYAAVSVVTRPVGIDARSRSAAHMSPGGNQALGLEPQTP